LWEFNEKTIFHLIKMYCWYIWGWSHDCIEWLLSYWQACQYTSIWSHDCIAFHKEYCSVNVQLSWLQSLKDIQLLQPVSFNDLNVRMHPQLLKKNCWLQHLAALTMQLDMNSSTCNLEESHCWHSKFCQAWLLFQNNKVL